MQLYKELIEAYSDKSLNRISSKLIEIYKAKNFDQIHQLANKISKFVPVDDESDTRCFSKIIMLYHPDRGNFYRATIKKLFDENENQKLNEYSHIFILNDIENIPIIVRDESIDYNPEYQYDTNDVVDIGEDQEVDFFKGSSGYEKNFYNAVKMRMYGDMDMEFPSYYLEDIDEIELAESGIESLDGVQFCKHAISIDLSGNEITDLSELWDLTMINELYLSNNRLGYIDALSNLINLRIIDLSGNEIDDISPLFELENLEYVNLVGNKVPASQIEKLKTMELILIY